jgi:hypothetical protein
LETRQGVVADRFGGGRRRYEVARMVHLLMDGGFVEAVVLCWSWCLFGSFARFFQGGE